MAVIWALIVGLTIWLTGWAFGFKAFDAFIPVFLLLSAAAGWRAFKPFVDRQLGRS